MHGQDLSLSYQPQSIRDILKQPLLELSNTTFMNKVGEKDMNVYSEDYAYSVYQMTASLKT